MKTNLLPTAVRGELEAPSPPHPHPPPTTHIASALPSSPPTHACQHTGPIPRCGSPLACLVQSVEAPPSYHRMSLTRRRRAPKRPPVEDPAPAGGDDVDALAGVCDTTSSRLSGEAPHNGRSTRRLSCCGYCLPAPLLPPPWPGSDTCGVAPLCTPHTSSLPLFPAGFHTPTRQAASQPGVENSEVRWPWKVRAG